MTPERWQKVKDIFNEVVELKDDERERFLNEAINGDDEMRREVEKLLASDENSKTIYNNFSVIPPEAAKDFIGNYKILEKIGEGGMGAVYLAERADLKQKVALKVIRHGADSDVILRRFRREQEILAALEHPNIARLLDVGISPDNVPFLAMEYVEGEDLTAFSERRNLSVVEKLNLFRKVCEAVAYAHSRLVVHRDLKPSNIIVNAKGEPKLLDFGISKLISETEPEEKGTVTSFGMLTPNYASPEQFRSETVSTSTDVYSLGVILYELLTGVLPYRITDKRPDEIARAVIEIYPQKPSEAVVSQRLSVIDYQSLIGNSAGKDERRTNENQSKTNPKSKVQNLKLLRGDLDNILLKSLRKEPIRRYSSVEQFSEDLRRHLAGLPVAARPDTFSYRAEKFIKRNAVSVTFAALVFLLLIGGIGGISWQYVRAERERKRAESRFNDVRELANNVVFKYHDAIKDLPGATGVREMLVKDAIAYLDRLASDTNDDPTLEHELAQAYFKIGNVQGEAFEANLGDSPGAVISYRKSSSLLEKLVRTQPFNAIFYTDLQKSNFKLVALQSRRQEWSEANSVSQRNLGISLQLLERDPNNAEYQFGLAVNYFNHGDAVEFAEGYEGQIKMFRQAIVIIEELRRADPSNEGYRRRLIAALQRIGTRLEYWCDALREQNAPPAEVQAKLEEAVKLHRRSVVLSEELLRDYPNNEIYRRYVAATTNNVCSALARIGNGRESLENGVRAMKLFGEIAAADQKNNEARHDLGEVYLYLGMGYEAANDAVKGLENYRRAVELFESLTVGDPTNSQFPSQVNLLHNKIGDLLLKGNRTAEAIDEYRRGLEFAQRFAANGNAAVNAVLQSNSNIRLGKVYIYLATNSGAPTADRAANLDAARGFYEKASASLLALQQSNSLNKIYFYKLDLLAAELRRCEQEKADLGA